MDKIFKSFADKQRRMILSLLKNGEMSVTEILAFMSIKQATLSSHLAILRKSGLVTNSVQGKKRIYKLNWELLNNFVKELNRFIGITDLSNESEIILRRKSEKVG